MGFYNLKLIIWNFLIDLTFIVYYLSNTPIYKRMIQSMYEWNKNQPIFLQIRQKIIEMILNGNVKSGEALPSVRHLATELSVNPLTVTKAYQSLVDMQIVEKKRGLGMFVMENSQKELLNVEREKFLTDEWPQILKRLESLGIKLKELIKKEAGA